MRGFGEVRVVDRVTALRGRSRPHQLLVPLLTPGGTRLTCGASPDSSSPHHNRLRSTLQAPVLIFDLPSFVALAFFLTGVVAVAVSGALRFGGILLEARRMKLDEGAVVVVVEDKQRAF